MKWNEIYMHIHFLKGPLCRWNLLTDCHPPVLFSHCHGSLPPLQCSASCGDGVMERTVQCVAADGQESNRCSRDAMPEAREVCRNPSCEYCEKTAALLTKVKATRVTYRPSECTPNSSIRYGLTWSGHLRDSAFSEIFMIRSKHQTFTVQAIYFPTVGWDIKEWVAFSFSLIRCSDLPHLT